MFTQKFDKYTCVGDTITCVVDGIACVARIYEDDCQDSPDERDMGFWPSLNPSHPGYIGPKSNSTLRRRMKKAQEVMDSWKNDKWRYVGVAVTAHYCDVQLTGEFDNALWGVECNYPGSDNSYLSEVANELLSDTIKAARAKLSELTGGGGGQMAKWHYIGDVNLGHGGVFYNLASFSDGSISAVRVTPCSDAGHQENAWWIEQIEVVVPNANEERLVSALECCGYTGDKDCLKGSRAKGEARLKIADSLVAYGLYDELSIETVQIGKIDPWDGGRRVEPTIQLRGNAKLKNYVKKFMR